MTWIRFLGGPNEKTTVKVVAAIKENEDKEILCAL